MIPLSKPFFYIKEQALFSKMKKTTTYDYSWAKEQEYIY